MNTEEFFQATNEITGGEPIHPTFNWVFWSLMAFNVFSLAYVRTVHSYYFRVLFRTGIYNRQLYQNTQEDLRLNSFGSVLLTLSYFNCVAVIASTLIPGTEPHLPLLVLGGIIVLVLLKYALMKSVSFMTQTWDGIGEHWLNHLIFFQVAGILLTPILCLTHFAPQTVQTKLMPALALFIAGMIFFREIQTFLRAIRLRISLFYIILYLCALELIPLAVVVKALTR